MYEMIRLTISNYIQKCISSISLTRKCAYIRHRSYGEMYKYV